VEVFAGLPAEKLPNKERGDAAGLPVVYSRYRQKFILKLSLCAV
jgi:hypothetical protein